MKKKRGRQAGQPENLHRPFLVAALVVTLSLGAGWGAYLLYRIGWRQSFEAVSPDQVIAHGAARLWGFVVLFVVGVSLRYLLAATAKTPPRPVFLGFAFWGLLTGVVTGFAWSLAPGVLGLLAWLSGLALFGGSLAYAALVWRFLETLRGRVWARAIQTAALWLLIWAAWTLYLQGRAAELESAAVYSLRDRQIVMDLALFGMALNSVYGFGQKLIPGFLSLGRVRPRFFELAFWAHNLGLIALLIGRFTEETSAILAGLWSIGAGTVAYVIALRGLRGRRNPPGAGKGHPLLRRYIQLAFGWLCLAVLSSATAELSQAWTGVETPHAVAGAIRHALTVGFLVTLILGVGQRLLPILSGSRLAFPSLVAPIFWLIASGNLLRVASEAVVPWYSPAFFIMPFSALLELTALLLFTASAVRTMWPLTTGGAG